MINFPPNTLSEPFLPDGAAEVCRFITPVGSRVTCNPPPTDTDQDYLVLINREKVEDFMLHLGEDGWSFDGSDPGDDHRFAPGDTFQSFSMGDTNLIVTASEPFYEKFLAATSVAKHLNLMHKVDRIALFQAVLYGNQYCPVMAAVLAPK